MVIWGLLGILILVLVLPFAFKKVEENLEVFLLVMGLCASLISKQLSPELLLKALEEPVKITLAVLIAGLLFNFLHGKIKLAVNKILHILSLRTFVFLVTLILGLISSVITAIIASLVLVEIVTALDIERKTKIQINIIACFAIGLGAALTPIGEPLSTIAISKMNEDFWYLVHLLGPFILPSIIALAGLNAYWVKQPAHRLQAVQINPVSEQDQILESQNKETFFAFIRAAKIYMFVMALLFLGEGFKPLIDAYVLVLDYRFLYWLNMVSAVLDNATLTAAELSPQMNTSQVQAILMGLLISGGMLIPGNIPNIISAGLLRIGSREWAKIGIPIGLIIMSIFFVILLII
jgi:predicted cation transporter